MSEDAVERHKHSKKRRHEDDNEENGKKHKNKKSKKVVTGENAVANETSTAFTADTPVASSSKDTEGEKKKKKKKDKHKEKGKEKDVEQQGAASSLQNISGGVNIEGSSSEDILRIFQQLDLTHLQGALGSLDLPSSGLDILPDEPPLPPTNPSTSKAYSGKAPKKNVSANVPEPSKRNKRKISVDLNNLVDPNAGDSQSALLATKWMSSKELKQFADTQGLVFKKGKFSLTEDHALKAAIEQYRARKDLSEDAMREFIFGKHTPEHKLFWADVALAVPGRPVQAVYHHVKRSYSPLSGQGKWIPAEDVALRRAIADVGFSWVKISEMIGRTAGDCRDRWRNHLSLPSKQLGKWSEEETEEMIKIIRNLTVDQGKDSDSEIFWNIVSDRMGGRRSREQCRYKWVEDLRFKMEDRRPERWSKHHIYLLLQGIEALPVNDESEIVWNDLAKGELKWWSAHWLQKAWKKAEKTVPDYEKIAYKDTVHILVERFKKYKEPKTESKSKSKAKKKKFPQPPEPKSAEVIEDSGGEQGDSDHDEENHNASRLKPTDDTTHSSRGGDGEGADDDD